MSGMVGMSSTPSLPSNAARCARKRSRKARALAACASVTFALQSNRSATPGPSGGAKRRMKPPSTCQASAPCTWRKCQYMSSMPSSTTFTGFALPSASSMARRAGASALVAPGVANGQRSLGASRRTVSGSGVASSLSSTSATRAKVGTSRANQPQVSRLGERSSAPCRLTRPCVGRRPTSPQWLAGARTEPPVSVPSAKSHRPLDTADAEPEDEPPAMRSGAAPLTGAPKCALRPFMENASSSVMVLPTKRAPASSSFCTVGAVVLCTPSRASSSGWPPLVG